MEYAVRREPHVVEWSKLDVCSQIEILDEECNFIGALSVSELPDIITFTSREEAVTFFMECISDGVKPALTSELCGKWALSYVVCSFGLYDYEAASDEDAELPQTKPLPANASIIERFHDYLWSCEFFKAEETHVECFDRYLADREHMNMVIEKERKALLDD